MAFVNWVLTPTGAMESTHSFMSSAAAQPIVPVTVTGKCAQEHTRANIFKGALSA
jgi:hypothetical protein